MKEKEFEDVRFLKIDIDEMYQEIINRLWAVDGIRIDEEFLEAVFEYQEDYIERQIKAYEEEQED